MVPFAMAQPDFLLHFAVIALDAPTHFYRSRQHLERNIRRQDGQKVAGGLAFPLGPPKEQRSLWAEAVRRNHYPFKQRGLPPSFGNVFTPQWLDPHESIVSIPWKCARMNGLLGKVLATQVAKTTIDPCDGTDPKRDAVDFRRLRMVPGLRLK